MQMKPVKSSQIAEIGHDPAMKMLQIKFTNGEVYRYHGVEEHQHHALVNSPSIGSHFHKQIRGRHKHERITVTPGK